MKYCKQCRREQEEINFIENEKDHKVCNKCRAYASSYSKAKRISEPEKTREKDRKYRENHLEEIREKDKLWKRKYREENAEEYEKYRANYTENNKDKLKAYDTDRLENRYEYFIFSGARKRARERGLEFDLTEEFVKILFDNSKECPLRKTPYKRGKNKKACDDSASIDRIDSLRGYTQDNVQVISYKANLIKNSSDIELFEFIINKLKNSKVIEHDTNDETRKIIIEDRINLIISENRESDKYRMMNLEKWLINSAKKRSKKKQVEINVDSDYLKSIWPLDNRCPILGEKFVFGLKIMSDYSATVDRIDNSKGYIKGNIQIISAKANVIKNKASLEELEFILKNWKELEGKK